MKKAFKHTDLKLIAPSFESNLATLIIELNYLRRKSLEGTTHPHVFFQLKQIFHTMESIGSARIEGNNTTVAEYIETKLEEASDKDKTSSNILEIINIEKAMEFIDENIKDYPINRLFLSELHKKTVEGLNLPPAGEGDPNPGAYRTIQVNVSNHVPPDPCQHH